MRSNNTHVGQMQAAAVPLGTMNYWGVTVTYEHCHACALGGHLSFEEGILVGFGAIPDGGGTWMLSQPSAAQTPKPNQPLVWRCAEVETGGMLHW